MRRERMIFALIMLFALAIRLPALFEPWGADQSVFAFIADGMLQGKVPYRDLYSSTGFGIFFIYAGLFLALGREMISLHLGDLAASLATVALVRAGARRLAGPGAGLFAAGAQALFGAGISFSALYQMGTAVAPYWSLAQRESFMGPLLLGAVLLAIGASRRREGGMRTWGAWVAAGLLVGLAAVLKFTVLIFLPVLAAGPLLCGERRTLARAVRSCVVAGMLLGAGFLAAHVPFFLWFASRDSLDPMLQAVFMQNTEYAKLSKGTRIETFTYGNGTILAENLPVWIFALMGSVGLLRRREREGSLLIVAAAVTALLSVWVQGKFFGYHFLVVFPFLCLLAGVGFEREVLGGRRLPEALRSDIGNPIRMAAWTLVATYLFLFVGWNYPHLRWDLRRLAGVESESGYLERFNEYPDHFYSVRADREVADYLLLHAAPGASLRLINDGGELVIFHWVPLESPTRFTSSWYLFNQALLESPSTTRLRAEFIDDTMAARPDYLLLVYYPLDEWPSLYPLDRDAKLREFYEFIRDGYTMERRFRDGRDLYRRR